MSAALAIVVVGGCNAYDDGLLRQRAVESPSGSSAARGDESAPRGGAGGGASWGGASAISDARVPGDVTERDAGRLDAAVSLGDGGGRDAAMDAAAGLDAASEDSGPVIDGSAPVGDGSAPSDSGEEKDSTADAEIDSGPPPCVPDTITDYCAQIPMLAAEAVIDGVLDCGPPLLALPQHGWNGTSSIPSGHETSVAIAVRDDGLYFYVEVHGQPPAPHPAASQIHCGDDVEIYVDADGSLDPNGRYSSPGTIQIVVAAPSTSSPGTIEASRFVEGNNQGAWSGGRVQTALLADGYAVEGYVTAADMGLAAWTPGSTLGIDVAIGVSAPPSTPNLRCGVLLGQYFLRVNAAGSGSCAGEPWCDTRAFCTPAVLP